MSSKAALENMIWAIGSCQAESRRLSEEDAKLSAYIEAVMSHREQFKAYARVLLESTAALLSGCPQSSLITATTQSREMNSDAGLRGSDIHFRSADRSRTVRTRDNINNQRPSRGRPPTVVSMTPAPNEATSSDEANPSDTTEPADEASLSNEASPLGEVIPSDTGSPSETPYLPDGVQPSDKSCHEATLSDEAYPSVVAATGSCQRPRSPRPQVQSNKQGPQRSRPSQKGPTLLRDAVEKASLTRLEALQCAWHVCFFARHRPDTGPFINKSEATYLDQLWASAQYYRYLRKISDSQKHYAAVAERFFLILTAEEYHARYDEAAASGLLDQLKMAIIDHLFPATMAVEARGETGADKEKLRSKLDYRIRMAARLAAAVRQYGFGLLIRFQFHNGHLHKINNPEITEFVDTIDVDRPNLREDMCNLSLILPKLLMWGSPPCKLAIERVPYEDLNQFEDKPLDELFSFPDQPNYSSPENMPRLPYIACWPSVAGDCADQLGQEPRRAVETQYEDSPPPPPCSRLPQTQVNSTSHHVDMEPLPRPLSDAEACVENRPEACLHTQEFVQAMPESQTESELRNMSNLSSSATGWMTGLVQNSSDEFENLQLVTLLLSKALERCVSPADLIINGEELSAQAFQNGYSPTMVDVDVEWDEMLNEMMAEH
ncbi:hypothetical protein AUP68_14310 [Ilyonectria robusta]